MGVKVIVGSGFFIKFVGFYCLIIRQNKALDGVVVWLVYSELCVGEIL